MERLEVSGAVLQLYLSLGV